MSEQIYRNFIFIERKTNAVVLIKPSLNTNYFFSSDDFYSIRIDSSSPVRLPGAGGWSYSVEKGFSPAEPSPELQIKLTLLQEKLHLLFAMKMNHFLFIRSVTSGLTKGFSKRICFNTENEPLVREFIENESRLLQMRSKLFFENIRDQIYLAEDTSAIRRIREHVSKNVQMGIYVRGRVVS